jgi:transcriptional regulator with XRE-family HTH domain
MQQPDLGRRLAALRKEKNLTQEELVEKSHVSVRTIQRIEAGEVLPRLSTVKILLEALGESYQSFETQSGNTMETRTDSSRSANNPLLTAVIAGAIYLVAEIIQTAMDITWMITEEEWGPWMKFIYVGLTVVLVASYILFARGFILLSRVFENSLLTVVGYLLIATVVGISILDVSSLNVSARELETLWVPYSAASVLAGSVSLVFGIALIRLQDSMGELSRIAGILEILMGCAFVTVILFFIGYLISVPAVIVEILLLYRGYEYLSRSTAASPTPG